MDALGLVLLFVFLVCGSLWELPLPTIVIILLIGVCLLAWLAWLGRKRGEAAIRRVACTETWLRLEQEATALGVFRGADDKEDERRRFRNAQRRKLGVLSIDEDTFAELWVEELYGRIELAKKVAANRQMRRED